MCEDDKYGQRRVYIEAPHYRSKQQDRLKLVRVFSGRVLGTYHLFPDAVAELERYIRMTVEEFEQEFEKDFSAGVLDIVRSGE